MVVVGYVADGFFQSAACNKGLNDMTWMQHKMLTVKDNIPGTSLAFVAGLCHWYLFLKKHHSKG